jgi:DNA-binding transcriptional MocR family regulator
VEPKLDRAIDPLWVSRQSLEADDAVPKPGCGWLPPTWMPNRASAKARCRRVAGRCIDAHRLRRAARASAAAPADQRDASASAASRRRPTRSSSPKAGTQAIDLICRFLLEPGDTVLVDDPCYFNFQALLRAHRVRVVSVPYTPAGPDIELFATGLAAQRPRLYITNSAVHNPTGATLSPHDRAPRAEARRPASGW